MHHQSEDYKLSTALRQTSSAFLFNRIFFLPLFLTGFRLKYSRLSIRHYALDQFLVTIVGA